MRSTSPPTPVSGGQRTPDGTGAAGTAVTATEVLLLQAVRNSPSVSLLMTTRPGRRMSVTDHTRLQDLRDQAVGRLRRLHPDGELAGIVSELSQLVERVGEEPTDQAVALYVGGDTRRALRLGLPVADRAVVDSTFATRDLVLALQRIPRHLVLVLSSREAWLFDVVNGALRPAATTAFPMLSARPRRSEAGKPRLAQADTAAFTRLVDRQLGTYRALHPSPLVVVGPAPVLRSFLDGARHADRLAGTVPGHHLHSASDELAALTRPVLQRYLSSREQEAVELLGARTAQGRVASGMPAAWLAARTERPEMLAVEQSLFYPARLSPDGLTIAPETDLDEPGVVDDAVDELVEHVLIRGGWVAFVEDGLLAGHGGVALVLR